jgi:hypothetical protein
VTLASELLGAAAENAFRIVLAGERIITAQSPKRVKERPVSAGAKHASERPAIQSEDAPHLIRATAARFTSDEWIDIVIGILSFRVTSFVQVRCRGRQSRACLPLIFHPLRSQPTRIAKATGAD